MVQAIQSLTLDVFRHNTVPVVYAKKNDSNARFIRAKITSSGKELLVPKTAKTSLNALRPDGVTKSFSGDVQTDGTVLVPIDAWICEINGVVRCEILISDDSTCLTTLDFLVVVKSLCGIFSGDNTKSDGGGDNLGSVYVDDETLVITSGGYVDASGVFVLDVATAYVSDEMLTM